MQISSPPFDVRGKRVTVLFPWCVALNNISYYFGNIQEIHLKRLMMVLMPLTAVFAVSARGLFEVEEISGTVSFTLDENGETVVRLITEDGIFVLNMPREQLEESGLQEGQEITVEGKLIEDDGGSRRRRLSIVSRSIRRPRGARKAQSSDQSVG